MPKTIVHNVLFKKTTIEVLYNLYMNAKNHSLVTGAPAKVSAKAGTNFSAHGDYIKGKILLLIKNKLIVQTWRGKDWEKSDLDSIFIIRLEQKGKDAILQATHANLPDKHASDIDKGWNEYYWKKWKLHLSGKPIKHTTM